MSSHSEDSEIHDKDSLISQLYNSSEPGNQYLICRKLEFEDISEDIPQLIQIMLTYSGPFVSHPIYHLLFKKSKFSLSFQIRLFLSLKTVLSLEDEVKASYCYFLCCDILDLTKAQQKKNIGILKLNQRFKRIKKLQEDNLNDKIAGEFCKEKSDEIEENQVLNDKNESLNDVNKDLIGESKSSDVKNQSLNYENKLLNDKSESLDDKNKILDENSVIDKTKTLKLNSIQKICESSTVQKKTNIKNENPSFIKKRALNRTISCFVSRQKMPTFHGIFLFFLKSVSSIVNTQLYRDIEDYASIFNSKKIFKSIIIPQENKSIFKNNISFLETLALISNRLKSFPQNLRQKALEIELQVLNMCNRFNVINPLMNDKIIARIIVDECSTLDSAENCPYMVFLECVSRGVNIKYNRTNKQNKARILLNQLNSLNEIGDIGDINGIRENMLDALEQLVFTNESDGSSAEIAYESSTNCSISVNSSPKTCNSSSCSKENLKENSSESIEKKDNLEKFTIEDNQRIEPNTTVEISEQIENNPKADEENIDQAKEYINKNKIEEQAEINAENINQEIKSNDKEGDLNKTNELDTSQGEKPNEKYDNFDKANEMNKEKIIESNNKVIVLDKANEMNNSQVVDSNSKNDNSDKTNEENIIQVKDSNEKNEDKVKTIIITTKEDEESDDENIMQDQENLEKLNEKDTSQVEELNEKDKTGGESFNRNSADLTSPEKSENFDQKLTETVEENIYLCDESPYKPLMFQNRKSWSYITSCIKLTSSFTKLLGWCLSSFIVKSGPILKQEYLAFQILSKMKDVFIAENLPIYLKNYKIYLISDRSGLIETVKDSVSIHKIKYNFKSLLDYFTKSFSKQNLQKAKRNFLCSLVGYSLASYFLQIKDRHNGNILIDSFGHIIHVDFGFILGKHPGFYAVENAPFKFASEYMELMDINEFRPLFISGFKALIKRREHLISLLKIMEGSGFCESGIAETFIGRMRIDDSEKEIEDYCNSLIDKSIKNMRTMVYDQYQYFSNGYL